MTGEYRDSLRPDTANHFVEIDDSDLKLELEQMKVRTRWVMDPRIVGTSLSVYLYLRQVAVELRLRERDRFPTQAESMAELGLGERAWVSAKKRLLCAGYLIEIRDRFPEGFVFLRRDDKGRIVERIPRGGQKRYRIKLRDPKPGFESTVEDAVFDLDCPYEEWLEELQELGSAKRRAENSPGTAKCRAGEEPLISPAPQNADPTSPALHNADPFIGTQEGLGPEGMERITPLQSSPHRNPRANDHTGALAMAPYAPLASSLSRQGGEAPAAAPSAQEDSGTGSFDESGIDTQLRQIHPSLSIQAFQDEVAGRVDLSTIDLVRASKDVLSRARRDIGYAPAYVTVAILKAPLRYQRDQAPFKGSARSSSTEPDQRRVFERAGREACAAGDHNWGPLSWPALDRAHCIRPECGTARDLVDPDFAQLLATGTEAPATTAGGALWGA